MQFQAVAALAYGTQTIKPVAKIVGPGNAYVAAAKRLVFGKVGIDMIAGPSEVLIIADKDANPDWIAADLLAQAEHDTAAQSILITDHAALADQVDKTLMSRATAGHAASIGISGAASFACADVFANAWGWHSAFLIAAGTAAAAWIIVAVYAPRRAAPPPTRPPARPVRATGARCRSRRRAGARCPSC